MPSADLNIKDFSIFCLAYILLLPIKEHRKVSKVRRSFLSLDPIQPCKLPPRAPDQQVAPSPPPIRWVVILGICLVSTYISHMYWIYFNLLPKLESFRISQHHILLHIFPLNGHFESGNYSVCLTDTPSLRYQATETLRQHLKLRRELVAFGQTIKSYLRRSILTTAQCGRLAWPLTI